MPYLLMAKSYEYDDQYYYENDGGYPELVFLDEQHLEALERLEAYRRTEWVQCTPLYLRYQDRFLSELSSSGLDEDVLAQGISAVLGKKLSPREILELDLSYNNPLSNKQKYLIGVMLNEVGQSYLEYVQEYREV